MILDRLENAANYFNLNPRFKKAFEFLKECDLKNLTNGKYEIEGEHLFVACQDYFTQSKEEAQFEAHRRYIDIQYLITGEENMGWLPLSQFQPTCSYDDQKDLIFGQGEGQLIKVPENHFVIFMPEDAHMPCIQINNQAQFVKKVVMKVLLAS